MSAGLQEGIALPAVGSPDEEVELKSIITELETQEALGNLQEQEVAILAEARTALATLFERERWSILESEAFGD